ncbi:MAG: hypothetical protein U9N49_11290, partial [Campylobacterota bacterium]|nr:hypothetical protein [Campylobacterota bacterium]
MKDQNASKHSGSGDNITGDKIINNNQRTIHAKTYIENYNVTNIYHKNSTPIPDIYNASIVSIYSDDEVVATGALITSNYIVTTYDNIANLKRLKVTFALREPQTSFEATLIEHNKAHNIALLQIEGEEPFNIPLSTTADFGGEFVACGFDDTDMKWIEGRYQGGLSQSKQQITLEQKPIIANSFSGAPLWDIAKGDISGVMINATTMLPIQKVIDSFKPLQEALRLENSDILSNEMFKDWVWTSSVESADKLQFSVLALVETVLAVSIAFFIWIHYNSYPYIIMGLIATPFFLLQTPKSNHTSLKYFHKLLKFDYINIFKIILISTFILS